MSYDPGELIERLRFEARAAGRDEYGNTDAGPWTEQFSRPAKYLLHSGSEAMIAARLSGRQPVTIIVRRDRGTRRITTDWRCVDVHTGTSYAINRIEVRGSPPLWLAISAEVATLAERTP